MSTPLASLAKNWAASDQNPVVVDLSAVSRSDSAGLALLLHWMGELRGEDKTLRFINIPHQVEDFIRINGLAELLLG